jgi:protein-arginine kinase activator protein McsA
MKTKEELKREVSLLAKRIKAQREKLWSLVKKEEFEEAELIKNEIKVWQKQLLDTLIGSEKNME